jgi:hypothetical protein
MENPTILGILRVCQFVIVEQVKLISRDDYETMGATDFFFCYKYSDEKMINS